MRAECNLCSARQVKIPMEFIGYYFRLLRGGLATIISKPERAQGKTRSSSGDRSMTASWIDHPGKVALMGAFLVLLGQLAGQFAGTTIPIMYGSQDVSDFSINIDPISSRIDVAPITLPIPTAAVVKVNITAEDFHPYLRPYRFKIYLQALGLPKNTEVAFNPPEIRPGDISTMYIITNRTATGSYPIIIQGIGGNGKIRNTTFYLQIINYKDLLNMNYTLAWSVGS